MNRRLLIVGAVLVLALLVAGFWFVFLRGDAPAPVSTEAGLEQLQEDLASEEADQYAEPALGDDDADAGLDPDADSQESEPPATTALAAAGTWIVDDEFGEFDFDTASGSFAGFRVAEELTVGDVTAVGRTGGVSGSLTIEDETLVAAEMTVDMTTIKSNDPRRERAIADAVRASVYPTARFVLTEPVRLDVEALESGATLEVDLFGELTVSGTTSQVFFHLHPTIVEEDLGLIVGSAEIFWSDFGVTPPRAPIVLSVADHGIVEFQLVVRRS